MNTNMNVKKIMTILVAAILVVVIAIIAVNISRKDKAQAPAETTTATGEEAPAANEPVTGTNVQDKFRTEVPKDIKVPEANEKLSEAEAKVVAVPTVVTAAAPGASEEFRSFNIRGEGGVFTPSKIIGNINDTIHINFTAVDKDYDIVFPSYNMKQTAKKGQTKVLEFQAVQEGSFTYYCQMCGGVDSPAKGTIIIKK